MSPKKPDKLSLLASLRRQATTNEPAPLPPVPERPVAAVVAAPLPPPVFVASAPAPAAAVAVPVPVPAGSGAWLERTSITLKTPDREALKALTLFLVNQGQQHVQTSTVIQAALQFTAAHLPGKSGEFLGTFERVRHADRRKIT